jgi:hypothetical protein
MVYNELEQENILSEVRVGLASIAYTDVSLRSIWAIYKNSPDSNTDELFTCRGGRVSLQEAVDNEHRIQPPFV